MAMSVPTLQNTAYILAPVFFYPLSKGLRDVKFQINAEVKKNVLNWLHHQDSGFFTAGIRKLEKQVGQVYKCV